MNGEEMLHCPYNYSHVILKSRMASHLQKCREQFPLEKYTTCPFNATHDVPIIELKYHAEICPDRKTMESYLYVMDDEKEEEEINPVDMQTLSLEENWDEERVSGSYLEARSKVKMEQKIFRALVGKPKSEKKAFSQSQVQKFRKDDREKLNAEKAMSGPSHVVSGVYKSELKFLNPESGMVKSSSEEEECREVVKEECREAVKEECREAVKKIKKSGVGRGSIPQNIYHKKDNI